MNRTGIELCDYTWNPIVGCSPVSEGCANCYAKRMSRRHASNPTLPFEVRMAHDIALTADYKQWANPPRLTLLNYRLDEPLRVKKPARIFVCSMSDFYHEKVCGLWRSMIWETIGKCPQHTFIILTKRPENIPMAEPWLQNVWLGVSVEKQENVWRWNELRWRTVYSRPSPALRFVSVEPMLGPVKFFRSPAWVIAGPETGPGARECRDEWIEELAAGSPCFFDKRKKGWLRREWPGDSGNHQVVAGESVKGNR